MSTRPIHLSLVSLFLFASGSQAEDTSTFAPQDARVTLPYDELRSLLDANADLVAGGPYKR